MDRDELHTIPLFDGIADEEYAWLLANSREVAMQPGEQFCDEDVMNDEFYIVLEGEMQISSMVNGAMRVLGTTPRGIIGGELGLLTNDPEMLVNAIAIAPTRLMVFDREQFRRMFAYAPTVSTRILKIASERMGAWSKILVQQEKMAALGKLSAGLAHELNNPAAAARRAASTLRDALPQLQLLAFELCQLGLNDHQLRGLLAVQHDAIVNAATRTPLSPLEQSDLEETLADWLDAHNVANAWECAPIFASAGVSVADLDALVAQLHVANSAQIINWLSSALNVGALLDDIEQSSRRISDLVGAVKEYTYMDQAPVQEIDIHRGLDMTLRMLQHKLRNVTVERQFDPELPLVQGRGSELNQVWTNLIDNAIDAMNGSGTLTLVTRCENDFVMIEVKDSGTGIPADVLPHIFEPFYTTKSIGSGTGLGLDITYRIVQEHHGSIYVDSQPGSTRFIVRLPMTGA
jgi:signal transduction histidine kinase